MPDAYSDVVVLEQLIESPELHCGDEQFGDTQQGHIKD